MISIIIPLYNKEKQIKNTLKSVLEQTFQDFEIIVVDDGSTDNGANEVLKTKDQRIRLVQQKTPVSPQPATGAYRKPASACSRFWMPMTSGKQLT